MTRSFPYRFIRSGLEQGDFCLYVTRLSVGDVREDMAAFGIDLNQEPVWMAAGGSELKCGHRAAPVKLRYHA